MLRETPASSGRPREHGEVHLGLLLQAVRPDAPHFTTYPVPPVELLAVCQREFPLKRGNTIEVAQLAAHPLLLLDTGFLVRKTFDAVCRLAGIQPDILIESRAHSNLLRWPKPVTASPSFHQLSSRIAMHCGSSQSPTRTNPFANLSL